MTFSRIKNLTSKNLPKISEAFTIVINLTPSNAWFEGVSLRPCLLNSLNKSLFCIFYNETQNLYDSIFLRNMCQNRTFIIPLNFHVFIKKSCFYKVRIKSQMARLHLYRQWFYKCYNSKSYNYINMTSNSKSEQIENISNTERRKTVFPK